MKEKSKNKDEEELECSITFCLKREERRVQEWT